ncbi:unnamed protein product [Brassica rapa subsp. trilocularis]
MSAAIFGTEDVTSSDMISHLPDDLLLGILSLVPISEAMNASLLSKRWISLWKMMPVLEYVENSCPNMTSHGFLEFCRRSLQLHEATVLKTLTIKLKKQSVSLILPSCFPETVFKKLVVLKLHTIFCLEFDVSPPVCFRSLKSLHITHVWFRDEESFCRLISSCPVLEDLLINEVRLRGRQRLEITNSPSLKYLKIKDFSGDIIFIEDMPNLVEATLKVDQRPKDFLRFLTSVEFLSIPLHAKERLLHLDLCIYGKVPRNVLLHLLKHSPKLQVLKLQEIDQYLTIEPTTSDPPPSVCNPSSVPECLSFHLRTFQWICYGGTLEEKEIVRYILRNARCLKTAAIYAYSRDRRCRRKERLMMKELKSMPKASTSYKEIMEKAIKEARSWENAQVSVPTTPLMRLPPKPRSIKSSGHLFKPRYIKN